MLPPDENKNDSNFFLNINKNLLFSLSVTIGSIIILPLSLSVENELSVIHKTIMSFNKDKFEPN